jgi:hypothetical protein
MIDSEREQLHKGIQDAFDNFDDGAIVVGWFLIAEVQSASGERYLAHRNRDINGDSLSPWASNGYIHTALESSRLLTGESIKQEDEDGDEDRDDE